MCYGHQLEWQYLKSCNASSAKEGHLSLKEKGDDL